MLPVRNFALDSNAPSAAPTVRAGIPIAVGRLPAFDQQCVRTMLRTLAAHLGGQFRVSESRDGELAILEDPDGSDAFILRARNGSGVRDVRLPRPLRLMPLADGLNSIIEVLRPQALPGTSLHAADSSLGALLAEPVAAAARLSGAWGHCWLAPHSDEVVFDRPLDYIARALATSDAIFARETMVLGEAAADFATNAKLRLRRDEVVWLCRPALELQRIVTVKLAQSGAVLKLQVWPNLARLPQHARWLGTFAAMQNGIDVGDALHLASVDGLTDVETRRGLCVLLQLRYASVQTRAIASVKPARVPVSSSAPSFLQRLKSRLLQMVETP